MEENKSRELQAADMVPETEAADQKPMSEVEMRRAQLEETKRSVQKAGDEIETSRQRASEASREIAEARKTLAAQKKQVKNTSTVKNQSTIHTKTAQTAATTDQLNDYIARLEAEMEAVDDSVRSAHLEKLIAADYRLQQLVNRIVKVEEERAMNELKKDSTANYINF